MIPQGTNRNIRTSQLHFHTPSFGEQRKKTNFGKKIVPDAGPAHLKHKHSQFGAQNVRKQSTTVRHSRIATSVYRGGFDSSVIEQLRLQSRQSIWEEYRNCFLFVEIRKFFNGKGFGVFSAVALIGALYLPDIFIVLNTNDATMGDAVLTVVMVLFAAEFTLLSIADSRYVFGAFWLMDFVGTVSMALDISYMWGTPPDQVVITRAEANAPDGTDALVYLRAGRMAKLGARAGRISRILKILRFLPFLQVTDQDSTMMAHKISSQLSNVLGTRIAFLTLVMAILMPIPGIFMYPVDDYSLRYIPQAIERRVMDKLNTASVDGEDDEGIVSFPEASDVPLTTELSAVSAFFGDGIDYGPYQVFIGRCFEDTGQQELGEGMDDDASKSPPYCEDWPLTTNEIVPFWTTVFTKPSRGADTKFSAIRMDITAPTALSARAGDLLAKKDDRIWDDAELIIAFNMRSPLVVESKWNMGIITFVMFILVGSGLLLSNSVSELTLRPMEQMFKQVRLIAKTVFLNVRDDESSMDDEVYAADHTSEMVLLDKIVQRLATMAELSTKKAVDVGMARSDMNDEDAGILQLMCGTSADAKNEDAPDVGTIQQQLKEEDEDNDGRPSTRRHNPIMTPAQFKELNLEENVFNSYDFIPLTIENPTHRTALAGWLLVNHPFCIELAKANVNPKVLAKCMQRAEREYKMENPYHNFYHAIDIVHTLHRMLLDCHTNHFITELEQFALLLSAVFHDIAHPGTNNPYLIDTEHELALRYNDRSPLENMHCSMLFTIISQKETAILENFQLEQYKDMRRICVECILHTDVVQHFAMVKELNVFFSLNSDTFDNLLDIEYPPTAEELALFQNADTKKLLLNMFLHTADVSNPCKPWKVCLEWANRVLEEFFLQGDKEKELGIPVQMLNDRHKVNKPNSQIGFIEFIVTPLIVACIKILPNLYDFGNNIDSNIRQWSRVWMLEDCPPPNEVDKVEARLDKVSNLLKDAQSRIMMVEPITDLQEEVDESTPTSDIPEKKKKVLWASSSLSIGTKKIA